MLRFAAETYFFSDLKRLRLSVDRQLEIIISCIESDKNEERKDFLKNKIDFCSEECWCFKPKPLFEVLFGFSRNEAKYLIRQISRQKRSKYLGWISSWSLLVFQRNLQLWGAVFVFLSHLWAILLTALNYLLLSLKEMEQGCPMLTYVITRTPRP